MKISDKLVRGVLTCTIGLTMATVPCQAGDSLTVYAEGTGASKDAATQNALRSAIEEHLGIFLSAKSLVENKALVSQEVTTYSKGIVKGYQTIEEVKEAGGYRVKLAAELLPEKIIQAFSKQPSIQISGSLDFINLQLKKERRAAALKISEQLVQRLMRDGYEITLGKTQYAPDESSADSARFGIPTEITTREEAWEDALKVLRHIAPEDSPNCIDTIGYTRNGNTETRETIAIYPQIHTLFRDLEPIVLVQLQNKEQKPLYVGMISLRGLTTYDLGGSCGLRIVIEAPPEHAQLPGKPRFSMNTTFVGATNSASVKDFATAKAGAYTAIDAKETMERFVPGSTTDTQAYPDLLEGAKEVRPLYHVDPLGVQVAKVGGDFLARNTSAAPWDGCRFFLRDENNQFWNVSFPSPVPSKATVVLDELAATPVSWHMICGECASEEGLDKGAHLDCSGGSSRGPILHPRDAQAFLRGKLMDGAGKPVSTKRFTGKQPSTERFIPLQSGPSADGYGL